MKFNTSDLKYVLKIAKDVTKTAPDTRPVLKTIQFKVNGDLCQVSVLDGIRFHTICIPAVDITQGDSDIIYVPMFKIPSKSNAFTTIEETDDEIILDFGTEKQVLKKVDGLGVFPDIKPFIPNSVPEFQILANPKLMQEAFAAFNDEKKVTIEFFGDKKPIIIRKNEDNFAFVLPMR